ncbi:hypothetical protein BGZ83_000675 [Gryganskiella cystojenkinii]|nr:hypothetical protein BGZ83_000675 [Gryganskiella cystojenkinii]
MADCTFDSTDPILVTIAQELATSKIASTFTNDNVSSTTKKHSFQLDSFLTRARPCHNLFSSRIQKQRYEKITVQERLILVSVAPIANKEDKETEITRTGPVLVAGLEILEYVLYPLKPSSSSKPTTSPSAPTTIERIVYVAKVDTSGCWPPTGMDPRAKSPAQHLVRGYLKAVRDGRLDLNTREEAKAKKTSLFVFARAQPQYLFAESAKNSGKRVLDDRGLVRWWKNMIGSVYEESSPNTSLSSSSATATSTTAAMASPSTDLKAYWYVPGMDLERQALSVIQQQYTQSASASGFNWIYGYPDKTSSEMAHTLIPQFPDDPKSRMMQSSSCQGGYVDIRTFWELTAIGEESGAGKVTGFFRVIQQDMMTPSSEQEVTEESSTTTTLTGTTMTIASTGLVATGSETQYTKMINYLLELDFSTLEKARESTSQWHDKVQTWIEKSLEADQIQSTGAVDEDAATAKKLYQKHLWIQVKSVEVDLPLKGNEDVQAQSVTNTEASTVPAVVHTLGAGLIKRKTPGDSTIAAAAPVVNMLGAGLIRRKTPSTDNSTSLTVPVAPVVNTLSAGLIRRKPTTSTEASTTTSAATLTTDNTSAAPVVNVLGASFIKKRKVDP